MRDQDEKGMQTTRGPGRPRTGRPYMLRAAGEDYVRWMEAMNRRFYSLKGMKARIRQLERYFGWEFDLRHLKLDQVYAYIVKRREQGLKDISINAEVQAFDIILRKAIEDEKLIPTRANQSLRKCIIKLETQRPEGLTPGELAALLKAAAQDPVRGETLPMAILIAVYTGVRHGELCSLCRVNFDLETRLMSVFSWSAKSGKERTIALPDILIDALKIYFDKMPDQSPQAWLFPGYGGRSRWGFYAELKVAFLRAGIYHKKRRPGMHILRKTWASNIARSSNNMPLLRAMAGWSSLKAAEPYFEVREDDMHAAVGKAFDKNKPAPEADAKDWVAELDKLIEQDGLSYEQAKKVVARMRQEAALIVGPL